MKGDTCGTWDCKEPAVADEMPMKHNDFYSWPCCRKHAEEADEAHGRVVWRRCAVTTERNEWRC